MTVVTAKKTDCAKFAGSAASLLTVAEMAAADRLTIENGLSGADLMEQAGAAIALAVHRRWPRQRLAVLCGPGNNGGDGYIAARHLREIGWPVEIFALGDPDRLAGDAAKARKAWQGEIRLLGEAQFSIDMIVIDALFGAGLTRDVTGEVADCLARACAAGARIAAVDMPSGVDGDTGQVRGTALPADLTVTFFRKKPGHLLLPGRNLCGEIRCADIGIEPDVLETIRPRTFENCPALWRDSFSWPEKAAHKYSRGAAAFIAGGITGGGAVRMAAMAALRAGAGIVSLFAPPGALLAHAPAVDEVVLKRWADPDTLPDSLTDPRLRALLVGPALGLDDTARAKLAALTPLRIPRIFDADALTLFAEDPVHWFQALSPEDVLTPHAGEFSRLFPDLCGQKNRLDAARKAAERAGAVVILKGPDSIIAAPDGRAAINANAPPFLATAGSGDVLAGILTGLRAQAMPAFEAAAAAVWLHGAAAQAAGPGLIATDLTKALPGVLRNLAGNR